MSITDHITSSRLIVGDDTHAFRDPTVFWKDGIFYLYCTYVETEAEGEIYMYTVLMRSEDLVHWSAPELIRVKGDMPAEQMGRMIDPYLLYDNEKEQWNCFYKQNGVSRSISKDLQHWEYCGSFQGGENVSVIEKDDGYYMFYSPQNGIGIKYSRDLEHWQDLENLLTFGQQEWIWARGRLTAGFVLPYTEQGQTTYLMFFHGTGPQDESVVFDVNASIGLAWSTDLVHWQWK